MLAGMNDAPETAHELGALLTASGHELLVNLIPWNPVFSPDMAFAAPDPAAVAAFGAILREQYGLFTTVRQEMGQARPALWLPPAFVFSWVVAGAVVTKQSCAGACVNQTDARIELS